MPSTPSTSLSWIVVLVASSAVLLLVVVWWVAILPSPTAESLQPIPDAVPNRHLGADKVAVTPQPPRRTVSDEDFFYAAASGELVTIQLGIQQGVDVDVADPDGQTPLMLAGFNGHLRVIRRLIDAGADVNHKSSLNRTPLMVTSSGPHLEAVKLLLHEGAEVNVRDSHEGWTALMVAATEGQAEIVEVLLAAGADKSLADIDGETSLIFATQGRHQKCIELLAEPPAIGPDSPEEENTEQENTEQENTEQENTESN